MMFVFFRIQAFREEGGRIVKGAIYQQVAMNDVGCIVIYLIHKELSYFLLSFLPADGQNCAAENPCAGALKIKMMKVERVGMKLKLKWVISALVVMAFSLFSMPVFADCDYCHSVNSRGISCWMGNAGLVIPSSPAQLPCINLEQI